LKPEKLTIRPARSGDAAAMLRVHRDAILEKAAGHYEQAAIDGWAVGVTPERVARFEQQIGDPAFIVLVAEVGGEVIGYGMAVPSLEELRSLFVKRNAFGRVGSALLADLEERAFRTSRILTCDASLNAVEFYKSNGYVEEGRIKRVLSTGVSVPGVRMKKVRRTE
jgi:L-amino acid N-acyltransferase YncA